MTKKKKTREPTIDNVKNALGQIVAARQEWLLCYISWSYLGNLIKARKGLVNPLSKNAEVLHTLLLPGSDGPSKETAVPIKFHIKLVSEHKFTIGDWNVINKAEERRRGVEGWLRQSMLSAAYTYLDFNGVREFYINNNHDRSIFNFIWSARIVMMHYGGNMNRGGDFKSAKWKNIKIEKGAGTLKISAWEMNLLISDLIEDLVKTLSKHGEKVDLAYLLPGLDIPFVQEHLGHTESDIKWDL